MSDIRTLSIDIETYSGYDLNKCGVYKYVEHPDFDILLFGYAVNEYSNASEPPFYRLRATSDFNTWEPSQTQDIVMEP